MKKFDPALYFITDSTGYSEEEFLYRVEEVLKGEATLLQLREKDRMTREYITLAEKVHEVAVRYRVPTPPPRPFLRPWKLMSRGRIISAWVQSIPPPPR